VSEILQIKRDQNNVNLQSRIRQRRAAIAKAQFDLISDIEALRPTMPEDDLKVFLAVDCGISKADLAPMLSFREILGDHEALLRKRSVPFAVIRSLISTDGDTRKMAIESLAAGDDVDVHRIGSIRKIVLRRKLGSHEIAERARKTALSKAAAAHARETLDPFGRSVEELLDEINEFVDEFIPPPTDDPRDLVPLNSQVFMAAKKAIEDHAASLQSEFRRIYGEAKPVPGTFTMWKTGSHAQRLAAAAGALDLFARGKFAWDGGFAFENGYLFSTEIQDALAYLLPCEPKSDPHVAASPEPKKALRFLEICAGGGGQAIGLMQAGFSPVGLIELNLNACKTLRKNWTWPVVRKRIERLSCQELREKYYGVDLLSGGVECRPFSRVGKQEGLDDPRNLFDEAVRYVKAIEPRAFFFENVVGFKDEKFRTYRASVYRQLEQAGYHVSKLHDMVGTDYGLAQQRNRVVLMGIKKSEGEMMRPPMPTKRGITTMGDALKNVLFPYLDQGNALYDKWANGWLAEYGQKFSPTVLAKLYKPRPELVERWEEIGFRIDPDHIADGPIKPGQADMEGVLPYLTLEVVKVLQGFPPAWDFEGKEARQFEQIGNAFPPPMAKAVGLSIARSLTGDAWRAEDPAKSLFTEAHIRNPPKRPLPFLIGPDTEFYYMVEDELRKSLARYKREKNTKKVAEFKKYLEEAKAETKAEEAWQAEVRCRQRQLWAASASARTKTTERDTTAIS
jgi:site-specific DNA-cytosine methylase